MSPSTLNIFERGGKPTLRNNVSAIVRALEAAGIKFVEGGVVLLEGNRWER